MHGVPHTPDPGLFDRVASLVCAPEDPKLPTAVGEHLGHEGQPVDRAIGAERAQDLVGAADSDHITGSQPKPTRWRGHFCRATGHSTHFTADAKPGKVSRARSVRRSRGVKTKNQAPSAATGSVASTCPKKTQIFEAGDHISIAWVIRANG